MSSVTYTAAYMYTLKWVHVIFEGVQLSDLYHFAGLLFADACDHSHYALYSAILIVWTCLSLAYWISEIV